jgi:hypothetical protein
MVLLLLLTMMMMMMMIWCLQARSLQPSRTGRVMPACWCCHLTSPATARRHWQ